MHLSVRNISSLVCRRNTVNILSANRFFCDKKGNPIDEKVISLEIEDVEVKPIGFAKAYEMHSTPYQEPIPEVKEESFLTLLRHSKLMEVSLFNFWMNMRTNEFVFCSSEIQETKLCLEEYST